MEGLLVAPLVAPLATAILAAFGFGGHRGQRALGVLGSAALLLAAGTLFLAVDRHGVLALNVGGWTAPFGITLVADRLASLMVLVTGIVALAVSVYAWDDVSDAELATGFQPFFHLLLLGVCGAFLTGDLFNLYVCFEVMLLASFVLLVSGGGRRRLTAGIPYVTLNLLASAFFLLGVGVLYGQVGSLNLADLSVKLSDPAAREAARPVAALLLVAFGVKAALFPVFFWLPAAYPTPAFAVSAVFAGLLTKVGVYSLLRIFTLVFPLEPLGLAGVVAFVAALTMASGVLAAASQGHVRRILSFHIVSQIGYMVLGLALLTPAGLAGAIFYTFHHIVTKTNLFLVGGLIARAGGSEHLARLGGLEKRVGLALLFAIPALSLAGVPPLSGFWAKLLVIRAGLEAEAYWLAAVALAVGLFTVFSMAKIAIEAFWKPGEGATAVSVPLPRAAVVASAGLGLVTVALGFGAEPLLRVSEQAAAELLAPDAYLQAVLGDRQVAGR